MYKTSRKTREYARKYRLKNRKKLNANALKRWYANLEENRKKAREYVQAKRERDPEAFYKKRKEYYRKNREIFLASNRRWKKNNRLKKRAQKIVEQARRTDTLLEKPCERCGSKRVDAHHEDYSKPLDVVWLCRLHHKERHRELRLNKQ